MINMLIGNMNVIAEECCSKSEMTERLSRCKRGYIITQEPDFHTEYMILKYRYYNELEWFGVGFFFESSSFPPAIIPSFDDFLIYIGCCEYIFALNLKESKIEFRYDLHSELVFAKCLSDSILVISELGAVQMKSNGIVLQEICFDDILETFKFEGKKVMFETAQSTFVLELI